MTLFQLIRKLQKLEKQIGPRAHVVLDVESINVQHNHDYSHADVQDVDYEVIVWAKDDNTVLANGQERLKKVVVLS
jgi:hypothetical protein